MDIPQFIAQVGFPMAVAAYLLFKLGAKLDAAERAALLLAERLDEQLKRCERCRCGIAGNGKESS